MTDKATRTAETVDCLSTVRGTDLGWLQVERPGGSNQNEPRVLYFPKTDLDL